MNPPQGFALATTPSVNVNDPNLWVIDNRGIKDTGVQYIQTSATPQTITIKPVPTQHSLWPIVAAGLGLGLLVYWAFEREK